MTKFICSKCQKEFRESSSLSKHLLLKKVDCNGIINTEYWLLKQIKKIHQRYKFLKTISQISDEEMSFEEKTKILKAFYVKTCNIQKLCEENREICPKITQEEVDILNKYIEACKSGEYNY